jgi:hypothetical protein
VHERSLIVFIFERRSDILGTLIRGVTLKAKFIVLAKCAPSRPAVTTGVFQTFVGRE